MCDCCDETNVEHEAKAKNHEEQFAMNKANAKATLFIMFYDLVVGCGCLLPIMLIGGFIIIGMFVALILHLCS